MTELKKDLLSRDYSPRIVDQAFEKARKIPRSEAIKRVEKVKNEREILAVEYHPLLPSVSKTVRKHWDVMTSQIKLSRGLFKCYL